PDAFEFYVAYSYNNLGFLYKDMQKFKEAQEFLSKAAELYERLNERTNNLYETKLKAVYEVLQELQSEI
ncbi:MAG: tetratricopeptide repeat protein, partial [Oscillospiraceae bacterium]|nr:tetratricopeptide repeat protein [Oscillospiraceae bacterium]